ncbi:MAG: ATP-binding protein [Bacteroidales bacterium]|nr:ATP-binding protein [Bacteroidales bacterium]
MSESISIREFGPIKYIDIPDLKKVNIFIGESGSGKSTIMKLLAAFQWVYKMICIRSYLKRSGVKRSPFTLRMEDILKRNGMFSYLKPDTEIIYRNRDVEIKYSRKEKLKGANVIVSADNLSLEKIAYISDKRVTIPNIIVGSLGIRHGLFYLEDTLDNFLKAWAEIPSTDVEYLGIRFETKKTNIGNRIVVSSMRDGKDFSIPLHEASSGIQSVSALHYIVEYFAHHYDLVRSMNNSILSFLSQTDNIKAFSSDTNIGEFPHRRIALHIEEPELSLFPSNQIGLMEHIYSRLFSQHSNNIDFQLNLASHSPYIINHLNLMMMAAKKNVNVNNASLPYEDVNLYYVNNGEIRSLKIDNATLIDSEILSESINDIYDKYSQLESYDIQ